MGQKEYWSKYSTLNTVQRGILTAQSIKHCKYFWGLLWLYWQDCSERWQETGWERRGMTCSIAPKDGLKPGMLQRGTFHNFGTSVCKQIWGIRIFYSPIFVSTSVPKIDQALGFFLTLETTVHFCFHPTAIAGFIEQYPWSFPNLSHVFF